jgi:hypothetical protein
MGTKGREPYSRTQHELRENKDRKRKTRELGRESFISVIFFYILCSNPQGI